MAAGGSSNSFLKWGSLAILCAHTLGFSICFRYARLLPGPKFSNITAVVLSEIVKLLASALLIVKESGFAELRMSFSKMFRIELWQTFLMGVPGMLYAAQNYLFFVGISNMSATLYNVTKQLAVLFTALLWVIMLKQSISPDRWLALCMLLSGVLFISVQGDVAVSGNMAIGVSAVATGCAFSAAASVFTEAKLKSATFTIWERNVQLSAVGILFGLIAILVNEPELLLAGHFFRGYHLSTWGVILLQSVGGMLTSAVLKYANSVLKCVTKSAMVGVNAACSRLLFGEGPQLNDERFVFGFALTTLGVIWYSLGVEQLAARCGFGSESRPTVGEDNKPQANSPEFMKVEPIPTQLGSFSHGSRRE